MGVNRNDCTGLVVGIDATNLRQGGGVTHLVELLRVADPASHNITKVVVWGCCKTLDALEDRSWLKKINPPEHEQGIIKRILWQWRKLSLVATEAGCDLLFVPGGSYSVTFRPIVTMSQNLLPFERKEARRFGLSLRYFRLNILRWMQSRSFRRADGVIFLTEYAKNCVLGITGKLTGNTSIIPHGLNSRFLAIPKEQQQITAYTTVNPYRLLYVSIVNEYKHQWHVVEAVAILRDEGLPLVLDLVGPAYPPALVRLNETITRLDPAGEWAHYHATIPYSDLHKKYAEADIGIFASSCENMPIILLEMMAAGLPIACSDRGPMPDMLGNNGAYFDPERPKDIARALRELIISPLARAEKAQACYLEAQQYSWVLCASATFTFLAEIARSYQEIPNIKS